MKFLDNLNYNSMTKNISLVGMTDEFFCLYISMLSKKTERNIVVVTPTLFEANKLINCLNNSSFFASSFSPFLTAIFKPMPTLIIQLFLIATKPVLEQPILL